MGNLARKLLLFNQRSLPPVEWLLFDDFPVDESAPLASPRVAQVGTWICNNTENRGSISGGALVVTPGSTETEWMLLSDTAFPPNTAIIGRYLAHTGARIDLSLKYNFPAYRIEFPFSLRQSTIVGYSAPVTSLPVVMAIARSPEGFTNYYIGDQIWWTNRLEFSTGDHIHGLTAYKTHSWQLDWVGVRTLPDDLQQYRGNATLDVGTAVSGTSYTADANGFYTLYVTAPDPLSGSAELRFRVQDDNNYWTAYFDSTGRFYVDSVADGTPTNRISVASVIGAGQSRIIRIITRGTLVRAFTAAGTTWSPHGALLNVNYLTDQTTVIPVVTSGWTLGRLEAGPSALTSAQVAELGRKT